jgi:hypothetical protein
MHLGHVSRRGCQARPDGPDRFVGDDEARRRGIFRQRAGKLSGDDRQSFSGFALRPRLADANNHRQARRQGCRSLSRDKGIIFVVIAAPLRMPDDDVGGAGVLQHQSRNVPGMGTAGGRMAILAAERHGRIFAKIRPSLEQSRRRTDEHFGSAGATRTNAVAHRGDHVQLGDAAIHLPISGDEWNRSLRHFDAVLCSGNISTAAREQRVAVLQEIAFALVLRY